MKTRIITALVIVAIAAPAIIIGGIFETILLAIVVYGVGYELLKLNDNKINYPMLISICTLLIVLILSDYSYISLLPILFLILLSIPVFKENFNSKDAFNYIAFSAIIYFIGKAFVQIQSLEINLIWVILFATYLTDIGAYFTGFLIGKHKLNPRISPKKTIEGSIGGYLLGSIGSLLLAYFLYTNVSSAIMAICFILPIAGQIGDLAFSSIKRDNNIKDFSNLFPGHGGILDRVDSLLFNLVVAASILSLFTTLGI